MGAHKLEVVAVDFYSGGEFILYFSDDTYVALSAETLAGHFPNRQEIPLADRRGGHDELVKVDHEE